MSRKKCGNWGGWWLNNNPKVSRYHGPKALLWKILPPSPPPKDRGYVANELILFRTDLIFIWMDVQLMAKVGHLSKLSALKILLSLQTCLWFAYFKRLDDKSSSSLPRAMIEIVWSIKNLLMNPIKCIANRDGSKMKTTWWCISKSAPVGFCEVTLFTLKSSFSSEHWAAS